MDPSTVIFLNSLFAFAALVVSVTGFGFAMVATPIAILVMSPAQAVPVVVLSWLPLSILLAVSCFREINTGRVLRLFACAMIGVPFGVHALATLDPGIMRTATGLVAVAGAGMMAQHAGNPFRRNALATCGAGILSGLMGGVSGMTGPPVVLLGLKQRWPHAAMRADLIGYFLILHNSGWAYPWRGPYRRVLGGYYQGHPPVLPFEVRVVRRDHPINANVSDFEIVDEQHFLWFDYGRVDLLLKSIGRDGRESPAGWAYEYGKGRVAYLGNGHTLEILQHPMVQQLLHNAVRWLLRMA